MVVAEGDPDADAHDHHTSSFPTTGHPPHPLLASAGTVVTGVFKQFEVHRLPVELFLVLTPYGGREKGGALLWKKTIERELDEYGHKGRVLGPVIGVYGGGSSNLGLLRDLAASELA